MKILLIFTIILAGVVPAFADYPTLEELTSRPFTNAVIIWRAPTNDLPKSFWIYQRALPQVFSEATISNAIVLASLQSKGFPKPSTNDFYIGEDVPPNWPMPVPVLFGIYPNEALLFYMMPNLQKPAQGIPNDGTIVTQARECARKLGLDVAQLTLKNFYTSFCDADQNQNGQTNNICGRGVFLSRHLDGILFFPGDEEGDGAEGFSIEFGSFGKIRSFYLCWSNVKHCESLPTANPQEIVQYIQRPKILVLPGADEEDYFAMLKKLAGARKVVITKITPYYFEGVFGAELKSGTLPKLITPVAELDAIADFGNTNATSIHLLSPILSLEATRLLEKNPLR